MRREGLISWLIVIASLALPSGSLYFWLTGTVDAAHSQEKTVKRFRDTPIFSVPTERKTLINPTVRQPEVKVHEEEPAAAADSAEAKVVPELPKPVRAAARAEPAVEAESEPESEAAPAPKARVAMRDPMLSPREQAVIDAPVPQIDAPATEPAPVARRVRRHRGKPIQDTVSVEAIIALAGASSAIVNGMAVKVGDMVGRLKVVMITADAVTFAYGATRFAKTL